MSVSNSVLQHCPDCSRVLYFSHAETNLIQCSCGSTIVRTESGVVAKPFYTVTQPFDLIQPGTEGVWNGQSFRVLGRIRAWIEEFVFNYWIIVFDDGALRYLGEGYGIYSIYERVLTDRITSNLLDGINVDSKRDLLAGETFILERQYRCYKWELEGEVWLPHAPSAFRTFEFASLQGRRLEAIELLKDVLICFDVQYVTQESLQLKQTRNAEPPEKLFACEQCKKEMVLKGFPFCQSFACVHCGTRYALEDGITFKKINQRNSTDAGPDIELGAKGVIRGIDYELIGYAQKEENNQYRSQWKEYTLFSPQKGFAFLSEYSGHWTFIRERGDAPVLETESVTRFTQGGEGFELYNSYDYEVVNAKGEFPYNAFNDGEKKAKEFISPPQVWIREKSGREGITWFLGEHITGGELSKAFAEKMVVPYKSGIGAVEPKGFVSVGNILRVGFGAVLLMILVHLLTSMTHSKKLISENTYDFLPSVDTVAFIKKDIVLDKWSSNLQFDIYADVDNSWCEVSGTLVDVAKGTEYSFEQGVEYYHGYSEGESWSEGDRKETTYLSSIPAGHYDLIIRATRETKFQFSTVTGEAPALSPNISSFHVNVTYDTTNDRNLLFCIIPVVLLATIHFLIVRHNERRRWYNSPFSPYTYNDED
ncbi:MAG: DUF4178 domain-containing protein [Chitinophagaceae bacterium]|nr:MAG: DUF4178 domain-containing protein [Chitinophagaceae bacterium]